MLQHFRQHNQRTTMSRPGGTTNARPIDEQALQVAQSAKAGIEEKTGQTYSTFNPTQYATQVGLSRETCPQPSSVEVNVLQNQVVAGTNYFFKIDVGDGHYVHARVYKDLQQNISVAAVQTSRTEQDTLGYFA